MKVENDVPENSFCSAMQSATGLNFYYVIADPNVHEKHISTKTVNAIVFKLQVIYSTVRTSK